MRNRIRIVLVPGSTRGGSTNVAALRAAKDAAGDDVTAVPFEGLADLPAFNPDDDYEPLPRTLAALREPIASADGILFCTPEYAGALPGSFKNLLDWTVGGPEIDGKPVAWINVAAEGRGVNAQRSLETVLGYLGAAVIEPAGRRVFLPRDAVGPDGVIDDPRVRSALADALRTFVEQLAIADRETSDSQGQGRGTTRTMTSVDRGPADARAAESVRTAGSPGGQR
jgi:chromate reductase, NAD(P)H dehydrogenase (quinone)